MDIAEHTRERKGEKKLFDTYTCTHTHTHVHTHTHILYTHIFVTDDLENLNPVELCDVLSDLFCHGRYM